MSDLDNKSHPRLPSGGRAFSVSTDEEGDADSNTSKCSGGSDRCGSSGRLGEHDKEGHFFQEDSASVLDESASFSASFDTPTRSPAGSGVRSSSSGSRRVSMPSSPSCFLDDLFDDDDGTIDSVEECIASSDTCAKMDARRSNFRSAMQRQGTLETLELQLVEKMDGTKDMDEDNDDDEEFLCSSTMDLLGAPKLSVKRSAFRFILGVSALLDCLSCLSPALLRRSQDEVGGDSSKTRLLYEFIFDKVASGVNEEGRFREILHWLDTNNDALGILFSVLWFMCAFGRASRIRMWILRKRDKERLLEDDQSDQNMVNSASSSTITDWFGGGWGVYTIMVGFQLLLLPVGFYVVIYNSIRAVLHLDAHERGAADSVCIEAGDLSETCIALSTKTQHSLGYAFFHHLAWLLSQMVKEKTKEQLRFSVKRIRRYLTNFAIRHPMKFRRKLKKGLRVLRWAKYLAPLIGASNKLKENIQDLLKKYRQRSSLVIIQRCLHQWRRTSIMSAELSDDEKQQRAPVIIQASWRARQKRRAFRALKMMRGESEMMAALRVQGLFRDMLKRARARIAHKERKLAALRKFERRMMNNNKASARLSPEQRKRMYTLQDELETAARKRRDTKMLLRPNTRFAVTWKLLFVCCVLIEITQLALKPKLDQFISNKKTKETMDWHTVLHTTLVPTPTTEWGECAFLNPPTNQNLFEVDSKKNGSGVFSFGRKKKVNLNPPWYCHKPYSTVHNAFVRGFRFVLTETLLLISVICFLDVFVTFFTGEIDPTNGALIPKPFFTRWVLPGIMLQLLINPMMVEVSAMVKALVRGVSHVGPIQAWRWSAALFIPVFTYSASLFERRVWRGFVQEENARI